MLSNGVIVLSEEDFRRALREAMLELKAKFGKTPREWIPESEAMAMLGIKSKTTLFRMRSEGRIRYSQNPEMRKVIMYSRSSIEAYLEAHAQETF